MIFLELFIVFFMIGLFTIGGGYAMLPMIIDQVVGRGWLSKDALANFVAIAESTPGPFAINTATLVGFKLVEETYGLIGAFLGSIFTTLGVVLPSFIIIIIIARYAKDFLYNKIVKNALLGIKAIVVGLILAVVLDLILSNIYKEKIDIYAIIIIVIIFTLKKIYKKLSPILLIIISGILGIFFYYAIPTVLALST